MRDIWMVKMNDAIAYKCFSVELDLIDEYDVYREVHLSKKKKIIISVFCIVRDALSGLMNVLNNSYQFQWRQTAMTVIVFFF